MGSVLCACIHTASFLMADIKHIICLSCDKADGSTPEPVEVTKRSKGSSSLVLPANNEDTLWIHVKCTRPYAKDLHVWDSGADYCLWLIHLSGELQVEEVR